MNLPHFVAGPGSLDRLVDTANGYARHATAQNTNIAYKHGWAHFARWCRGRGAEPLPPNPQLIGLYITDCAAPDTKTPSQLALRPLSASTIERRLSGLAWHYQQRGFALDRQDRHIATVLAGLQCKHARPPIQKEAVMADDIVAMVNTLPFDLHGLRDRAILLIGFAGGLQRSEFVGLDLHRDDTLDADGGADIQKQGLILRFRGKTGYGSLLRPTSRDKKRALDERHIQKHLGHASADISAAEIGSALI